MSVDELMAPKATVPMKIALQADMSTGFLDGLNPVFHPEQLGIANATYWEGNRAEDNLAVEDQYLLHQSSLLTSFK